MGPCNIKLAYGIVLMIGSIDFGLYGIYPSPTGDSIRSEHHLKDTSIQWVLYSSISFLAAIFGSFLVKLILAKFNGSRKMTVFIIDCIAMASWLLNCLTKLSIIAGIFMRVLCGISMGSFMTICTMYLVEIAPEGYSGVFGSFGNFGIVIGNDLFCILGPYLNYMELNYVGAGISALQGILIWSIEESPVVNQDQNDEKPLIEVFKAKYVKNLICGIIIMFIAQFCGVNGILTNISIIMTDGGLDMNPNFQSAIAIASQLISTFISILTVERLGRKIVWIISSAICAIGLLILALNEKFKLSNILPVVCIFVFLFGFSYGIGKICWFIVSETFESDIRPAANSACLIANWIFSFVIVISFPSMKKNNDNVWHINIFLFYLYFWNYLGCFHDF